MSEGPPTRLRRSDPAVAVLGSPRSGSELAAAALEALKFRRAPPASTAGDGLPSGIVFVGDEPTPGPRRVVCVRDPVAVAASLGRDGIAATEAYRRWQEHVSGALLGTAGVPRLFVDFIDWLERPEATLHRLAEFVGRRFIEPKPDVLVEIAGLADTERERGVHDEVDAPPEALSALWSAVAELAGGAPDGPPDDEVLRIAELARERAQLLAGSFTVLADVAKALERIGASRSWRYGHRFFRTVGAATRRGGTTDAVELTRERVNAYLARARTAGWLAPSAEAEPVHATSTEPTPIDRAAVSRLAQEVRARLGPARSPARPPAVSAVVVNRNGRRHLEQLLGSLEGATDYDNLEVVVVDNGSTDDSLELLEAASPRFRVVVVRNPRNESYSDANNRGAAAASGELLVFLNNDVIAFEANWLSELVACRERTGAAIVGARLVQARTDAGVPSGWALQHRAIRFRLQGDVPVAVNEGAGEDALADGYLGEDLVVPAVTAACLMIGAEAFAEVGGFDHRYWYGSEDVDLALVLAAKAESAVACGRAMLIHDESSTQRVEAGASRRIHQLTNRAALLTRWGPRLRREVALDQLAGGGTWALGPARIGLAGDPEGVARMAEQLADLGLEPVVGGDPAEFQAVVDLSPAAADPQPERRLPIRWPASRQATGEALRTALRQRESRLRFCLKIAAPDWMQAPQGGDVHFAAALQRELERRGHTCLIQVAEEWDAPEGLAYDVVVQLKGRGSYLPRSGQLNVLWSISHPAELTPAECEGFDLVCVASERYAAALASTTQTPVAVLEQATDPALFHPDPRPEHRCDAVFVGNTRGAERPLIRDLFPTDLDLRVWGNGWAEHVPAPYHAGERLSGSEVRQAYSSATVVLNDHWPDMREQGYVSNRVYDALACGTLVVSDHLPELEERFGGCVLCYRSRAELKALLTHWCSRPEEAREAAARGREIVLTGHTFAHRVDRLLELVDDRRRQLGTIERFHPSVGSPHQGRAGGDQ